MPKNWTAIRVAYVACALMLLLAAAPAKIPAGPPPVTIFKTDGTSVRGQLGEPGHDFLTITPAPKPGEKPDALQPQKIEWKDIKSVSNGLTPAKSLVGWKAAHRDDLCVTCRGDGVHLCPTCKGTGHDPASGKDCHTCHGELLVACTAPKCKDGQVPCPAPCLKLSEGVWVKRADGKLWRDFHVGTGTASISSAHVGQVWEIRKDGMDNKGFCTVCGGKTTIDCAVCGGHAKIPCPTCVARKDAPACPDYCDHGKVICETCKGSGLKEKA